MEKFHALSNFLRFGWFTSHYEVWNIFFIDLHPLTPTMSGTFLICIHNVSKDQPYVILRASICSTANDIIKEVPS